MEKSIEFSVINQAADGEKTLTEGLMSMVDPVTERRPHRSTIGQARCSDAVDRTPTGTPKRASITDRSLEVCYLLYFYLKVYKQQFVDIQFSSSFLLRRMKFTNLCKTT